MFDSLRLDLQLAKRSLCHTRRLPVRFHTGAEVKTITSHAPQSSKRIASLWIQSGKDYGDLPLLKALELSGGNTGNNVFGECIASKVHLTQKYNSLMELDSDMDRLNSDFDILLITPANILNNHVGEKESEVLGKVKLPICPLSIGIQAVESPSEITNKNAFRLARTIAERSPLIGVRCAYTAEFLSQAGIKNVQVIGCPSLFMFPEKAASPQPGSGDIFFNWTPYGPSAEEFRECIRRCDLMHAHYIAQDESDVLGYFKYPDLYSVFRERSHFFFRVHPWLKCLSNARMCIGTRLHGNIMALSAGRPALTVAPDLRVRGVLEHFHLPYISLEQWRTLGTKEYLYFELMDYDNYTNTYPKLLSQLRDYFLKYQIETAF